MIALLVMTDGRREFLQRTLASANDMITGPITRRVIHDDSGDPAYRDFLAATYPQFELITTAGRSGFGAAIDSAWSRLAYGDESLVFHLEDDFLFNRPVDLADLALVLDAHPHLAQLALRRQPWNDEERAAGGIVERFPDAYTDVHHGQFAWLEHRLFFTTNPCLYRSNLCRRRWPAGGQSEGRFSLGLVADGTAEASPAAVRFGFWGARDSGEWVEHIGAVRAGTGY